MLVKVTLKLAQIICPKPTPTWWQDMKDECYFIQRPDHKRSWAKTVLKEAIQLRYFGDEELQA